MTATLYFCWDAMLGASRKGLARQRIGRVRGLVGQPATRLRRLCPFWLGPVNTYLSASKMSTKWMKPMNITSSFSNRENIRR